MKVFINKRTGGYSGGMVIVAANNVDEAQRILLKELPDSSYAYDKEGNYCYSEADTAEVKNYYYDEDNWVELLAVTADYEIPTFIAEDGYSE